MTPHMARAFALVAALTLAGCGPSVDRQPISGTVTHDGKPIEYGVIFFAPDTSKGNTGPQGSAEIRKGSYQTGTDKGPVAGPHTVRITGWNSSPESGILGAPAFSDYTTNVDISGANNQLDFAVPANPTAKQK
ncbi:MAG: hypothetical protein C0467_12170 [Planctomycetaceae bacterium]|nr:hypothetical protein [Planctomycetaceae bacterium]